MIVSSVDTVVHASVGNCVNIDDLLFLEKDQLQGYNYPKIKHRKNNIKQHNMMIDGWAVLGSSKLPLFLTFSGASLPSDLQISKAAFATQLMPCWSSSNGTGHVLGVPCKTWSSITRSLVSPRMCAFCFPNEIYWICFSKGACLFFFRYDLRLKIMDLHV